MGINEILQLAGQFGMSGAIVFYLVWDNQRKDKWAQKHAEDRLEAVKDETASREKLASALTALTMVIQGRARV